MYGLVFSLAVAGLATAQQVTMPAILNQAGVVAADIDACSTAAVQLLDCASEAGGIGGLLTTNPDDLLNCACCARGTPIATAYSSCSDYMGDSDTWDQTDIAAYGSMYSVCSTMTVCDAAPTDDAAASTTTNPPETTDETSDNGDASDASETDGPDSAGAGLRAGAIAGVLAIVGGVALL